MKMQSRSTIHSWFYFFTILIFLGFSNRASADLLDFANPGASLSFSDYQFVGENVDGFVGDSVASAGDVDGDGRSDILIGANGRNDGGDFIGSAYLILGASLDPTNPTLNISRADYHFIGENDNDWTGNRISSAGDVDGDGLSDILIAAPYNDDGGGSAGKVYLVLGSSLGSTATIDLSTADYQFIGEDASDAAGYAISSAGDVDSDGLSDILISADYYNNADSEATDPGKVYLILGASLGSDSTIDLSTANYQFIGENVDDYAGWSVSSAGDVDGDSRSDILIGARNNDDGGDGAGKAYLVLGSSLGSDSTIDLSTANYQFIGENAHDLAGDTVSSAGDVDRDGLSDILIGALGNDDGGGAAGKTYLVLGSSLGSTSTIDLSTANYQFIGENDGDYLGSGVSSAGDVDGDGLSDILIGAPSNDEAAEGAGKIYLVLGSSLGSTSTIDLSTADYQFTGENYYDRVGSSISSAGDVDGDGRSDILIGVRTDDEGSGDDSGKTHLILAEQHCDPDDLTDTVYVDGAPVTYRGIGTEECPLETITAGINKAVSTGLTRVVVQGWFYDESVTLETGIELIGNGRTFFSETIPATIYDSTDDTEYLVQGANAATMENFVIEGGVQLDGVNNMTFSKNYIYRPEAGLTYYPALNLAGGASNNTFDNNVIYRAVNYNGIVTLDANSDDNIFINNTLYSRSPGAGIAAGSNPNVGVFLAEYTNDNEFRNNIVEPKTHAARTGLTAYGFYFEDNSTITATIENNKTSLRNYNVTLDVSNLRTRQSCGFENPPPAGTNFHLTSSSICIDRGDPDASYNDTDGTRNDLGAYGGPEPLEI